jgi:hypothetical protein
LAESKINRVHIADLPDERDGTLGLYFSCFFNHGFNMYCYTYLYVIDESEQFDARNLLPKVLSFLDAKK